MAEEKKTNVVKKEDNLFAILGFIFSVSIILCVPGFILSLIGLLNANKYKIDRKKFALIGIIVSSVVFVISIVLLVVDPFNLLNKNPRVIPTSNYNSSTNYSNSTNSNTSTNSNNTKTTTPTVQKNKKYTLGDTIEFDGYVITFDKEYSFDTLSNQFSEYNGQSAVKIGVTVKNVSGKTGHINRYDITRFGSKGTESDNIDYYFDESLTDAGDIRDGASYYKYIYILYDGNGTYGLDFDNYITTKTVEFEISM